MDSQMLHFSVPVLRFPARFLHADRNEAAMRALGGSTGLKRSAQAAVLRNREWLPPKRSQYGTRHAPSREQVRRSSGRSSNGRNGLNENWAERLSQCSLFAVLSYIERSFSNATNIRFIFHYTGGIMNRYQELLDLVQGFAADFDKFYAKGNKAAGTRVRKHMNDLKKFAQDVRNEVQSMKKTEGEG